MLTSRKSQATSSLPRYPSFPWGWATRWTAVTFITFAGCLCCVADLALIKMTDYSFSAQLNYAWLLFCVAGVVLWRLHGRPSNRFGRTLACSAIALACSAVLLFPVISANDDLVYVDQAYEQGTFCGRDLSKAQSDHIRAFVHADFNHRAPAFNAFWGTVAIITPSNPTFQLVTQSEVRPPPLTH